MPRLSLGVPVAVAYNPGMDVKDISQAQEFAAEKMRKVGRTEDLKGKVVATLFFEPSTRPRLSFETAVARLGGGLGRLLQRFG